jgi:Rho-binding antiterminator
MDKLKRAPVMTGARFVYGDCLSGMETNTATTLTDAEFQALIPLNKFVRLHYFTELREFIKTDALTKAIANIDGVDHLELATGEKIPLDRVIRIDGHLSPKYPGYDDYSCAC